MRGPLRASIVVAALAWLVAVGAQAADWELYPDPATWLPVDQTVSLPVYPDWAPVMLAESDSSWMIIDVHQTREKDGLLYKALQLIQDTHLEATVPVGTYFACAAITWGYPVGHGVDMVAWMTAFRLISIEVDGTVIPIDIDTYLHPVALDLALFGGEGIWEGVGYNAMVKFNVTGAHTYKATFQQVEDFYYIEPYALQGLEDPSPEYEGRRVLVGEQVGAVRDGYIVYDYALTVVDPLDPGTAVESCGWARVKAALPE